MSHQTVLLTEAVEALQIKPNGIYVDATFGRGGHSQAILAQLGVAGRLIVCDQDMTAIAEAGALLGHDDRVTTIHDNFGHLDQHLKALGLWGQVDGILFDLGVSSPQLDESERGFSFLRTGPLDMRMDQTRGMPVSEKLKTLDVKELTRILREYGEEKFANKIAVAILAQDLKTTKELADLIEKTVPKKFQDSHKHPATRTFQALRIWVNEELSVLEAVLQFFPEMLALNGRAVFISFHSLEDRLVKVRMNQLCKPPVLPRGLPIRDCETDSPAMQICIKMQKPSDAEIKENSRARSAVLRVIQRLT